MTEEQYRIQIDKYLSKYFDMEREVWSVDGKSRIDYVLKCKISGALFGLEVKRKQIQQGKDVGAYLQQSIRYSKNIFSSKFCRQQLPIFISPAISSIYKEVKPDTMILKYGREFWEVQHTIDHKHSNINGMIGQFNIGEIRKIPDSRGDYIIFSFRNKTIWSSRTYRKQIYGLKENNYKEMMRLINK